MRINELLIESQQLDEGPFTQAIGKGAGKVARGIANIGKDLKTGFKAGYSGEQPAAAPAKKAAAPATAAPATAAPATAAPATAAPATAAPAAPVKKAAAPTAAPTSAIDQLKQGFAQGQGEPAQTEPAANPEAEKQSKIGVGQINKIIPTLRTRDLMSLQANLEKTIASKKKAAPAPAANAAPAPGSDAAKDELYGAGNRPKGAKDKVAALKSKNKKKAAPTQAEIDADRDRLMGNFNDSIERHKQRMVAEGFANGSISIFKQ
jgi:hypothetical protein